MAGMPRPCKFFSAVWLTTACLLPTTAAGATPVHGCKSADLRYPFQPGGPKAFGVFRASDRARKLRHRAQGRHDMDETLRGRVPRRAHRPPALGGRLQVHHGAGAAGSGVSPARPAGHNDNLSRLPHTEWLTRRAAHRAPPIEPFTSVVWGVRDGARTCGLLHCRRRGCERAATGSGFVDPKRKPRSRAGGVSRQHAASFTQEVSGCGRSAPSDGRIWGDCESSARHGSVGARAVGS